MARSESKFGGMVAVVIATIVAVSAGAYVTSDAPALVQGAELTAGAALAAAMIFRKVAAVIAAVVVALALCFLVFPHVAFLQH